MINMVSFDSIIIYLRKSRSDDPAQTVEEVLAKHERILQDYCMKEYGKAIPEKRIYREVVSGETIQDRPVMQQLLKELETGNISGVLIVEPQRLSRGDLQDCGQIINSFRYTNTAIITPGKTYNLSDEYDRKFFEMELTRGNDYLEYTKKILNRGRVASVRQGNYICSVRPYGYKKITLGSGKDKCHTLEIIPEEADAIRLMYHLYLDENMGFTNIARTLDSLHIKPLKSDNWSAATIRDMIDNPIYIGKVVWNSRKVVKKWENEQITKVRPRNKGDDVICVNGRHEAIIDEHTFEAARNKRGLTPKVKKFKELRNPLAGLLFCGTCGHGMSMKKYVDKRSHTGKVTTVMLCNQQAVCHTKSAQYEDILAKIKVSLSNAISDFKIKLKEQENNNIDMHELRIASLEEELNRLYNKDVRQKDAYEDGIYTKEEYIERNSKLQERILNVKEEIADEKNNVPVKIDYEDKIMTFKDCLSSLDDSDISAADKNILLKSCIDKIIYYNDMPSKPGIGRYIENSFRLEIFLKL